MGDKSKTARLTIEWEPDKWFTKKNQEIPNVCLDSRDEHGELLARIAEFEPDCDAFSKKLLMENEKNFKFLSNFKIDVKTKGFIEKTTSEKNEDKKRKENWVKLREDAKKNKQKVIEKLYDKNTPIEDKFDLLLKLLNLNKVSR